jgi:RNA polymerase sigma factor (sigma-70 family)
MVKGPDFESSTDEQLAALACGGGADAPHAMSALLGRWRGRVYLWCRRFTRDHERALDLAQDVLLIVYGSLGQYEGRAPLGAWIYTITRRACIRAMRPVSLTRDDDADLEALKDRRPEPAVEFEQQDDEERVLALIHEHLSPDEQRALWLRGVERMPVDEITRLLGLESASGARGLLQTARRKLRAVLGPRGPGEDEGAIR